MIPRDTTRDLFAGKLTWSLEPQPHDHRARSSATPATIDGPVFAIAGPEVDLERHAATSAAPTASAATTARFSNTLPGPRDVRPAQGEEHVRRRGQQHGAAASTRPSSPNARAERLRLLPGPGVHARRGQARPDQVRGHARDQARRRLRARQHERSRTTRAAPASASTSCVSRRRRRSTTATATTSTTSPRASTATIRPPGRSRLPQVSEPRSKSYSAYLQDSWKVTPYFTLNLGVRWEQQDVQNRFHESAFKLDDNWAPRLGFVWDVTQERQEQALRELRPLLRERPAGHQHPRVRRRGRLLLLQLQLERRRHRPDPARPRARRCSAAPSRSTRTSRASTSTRPWAASSTRWRRTSCSAPSSPTASWGA